MGVSRPGVRDWEDGRPWGRTPSVGMAAPLGVGASLDVMSFPAFPCVGDLGNTGFEPRSSKTGKVTRVELRVPPAASRGF